MRDVSMFASSRLQHVPHVRWLAIAMLPRQKRKIVDVFQTDGSAMKVGDTVTVSTTGNIATQALLWAFGFPFILMVAVLVIVLWQTKNEGMAALSGLLTLIPYYGLLFLLRHRMRRKMSFVIE